MFTSFHAYEYSNSVSLSKVHRNIIFRNELVPELPISSLEEPDVWAMWDQLDSLCDGDCEAISIPHNPNASNGRSFTVMYRDLPLAEQVRRAKLRARMEPVVEMMQIKGESECKAEMWKVVGEDELWRLRENTGNERRRSSRLQGRLQQRRHGRVWLSVTIGFRAATP